MEIIDEFGINPVLLVAQAINFLIILFIFKRFLYKPLLRTIKKREDEIKQGLKSAEEGREILEKAKEEEAKLLQTATNKAEQIVSDAKEQTQEMLKLAEEEAKKRTEKMLADANLQIEDELSRVKKELVQDMGKVSINILEKALEGILTGKEQKEVIKKAIKNIKID